MKRAWRTCLCGILLCTALMYTAACADETPSGSGEEIQPAYAGDHIQVSWDPEWEYAEYSQIHDDPVTIWRAAGGSGYTVAVNAGHGTSGGPSVRTLCHPDGTPKVTGGSTAEGETTATAVSAGTQMLDGTAEAQVNLSLALLLKDVLLKRGYDVLMIREDEDVQLDNIARTVFANQLADCHIALHYDSTDYDKGLFYMSVPDVPSYLAMEPVASHREEHERLGKCIINASREAGIRIFESGSMPMDLTQTSYSTVPSIDLEAGDRASDYSGERQAELAEGIADGLDLFFFGE